MPKDDFFVIAYKILSYLYECNRAGKIPAREDYCSSCEMFQIPEAYWCRIMGSLIGKGYISGAFTVDMPGQEVPGIKATPGTGITMDGVQFLHENSMMTKVGQMLGKGFEVILSSVITAK